VILCSKLAIQTNSLQVCAAIAAARDPRYARFAGGLSANTRVRSGIQDGSNQWSSKLCANESLATAFHTEVQEMIATLAADHAYDRVLQKRTEVVAYLKNAANAEVLKSNCTEYFAGYKNARKLDLKTEQEQAKYEANVDRLFRKILVPLVGARFVPDADF
jgi:hypothetical protein